MNRNLSMIFSIFLLVGIIILVPAYAQSSSDNVVINEVDTNPPGNDAASVSEWVELYNPTDSDIDLSGWEIASTTVLKKTMSISSGTVIEPGQFLTYSHQTVWFTDSSESVELRDKNGIVIDKTPVFTDIQNDFTSWQRIYDGYDLDSSDDWKFAISTAGSSNGRLIETQDSEEVIVTISSEKPSYLFGDVAVLEGDVSEQVLIAPSFILPEPIMVTISGPNFYKTLTLYPDLYLNYDTSINLQKVLGIDEGTYDVTVDYAGATADTSFSVGFELVELEEKVDGSLGITTDSPQYLPGQTVLISGLADEIVPFEGMEFTVTDSQGVLITTGNLFPTNGKFTTSVFLTTISPDYGTYEIDAQYSGRSASTTFEVVEDIKEDAPISLWTDKVAYGLGDTVTITGRLNTLWINALDLEIQQTTNIALGGGDSFKIRDIVRLDGDGTFGYSFTIPISDSRLGDYRIKVAKDASYAATTIHAVSNPGEFVASDDPLTINSDKEIYESGGEMIVSGFIRDLSGNSSYQPGTPVEISISHKDRTPLKLTGLPRGEGQILTSAGLVAAHDFTAIPETSGGYSLKIDIVPNIFTAGDYTVKSRYLDETATKTFTIIDPLDLTDGAAISLEQEVYGLGETVYLTGIIPPTSDRDVNISLTKPDGTMINSAALVENQRFSWSWITPITEKYQNIKTDDGRDVIKSNFGVYKIKVSTSSDTTDLFFKVSADPENDSLSTTPLFVSTDKSLYKAGETLKVTGSVIKLEEADEGLIVPERVQIKVTDGVFPFKLIHESFVYPDQGGGFSSNFELPVTIFSEGPYLVQTLYANTKAEVEFSVANDFVFGVDGSLSLLVTTDKSEYHPGDTVIINGKPSKLIYLEKFDVSVIQKTDDEITCGSFICGANVGPTTSIRPSPSGSFTYEFLIPDSASSVGSYEVTVDANFDATSTQFVVIQRPETLQYDTVIEKENRISEKMISILTEEKTIDGVTLAPRVISGSMITPSRDDESSVNLKLSTVTGICIIGPDVDCLVSESTRKQGQIYDVVKVDGIGLNVRYTGPDVRLEKFSILPESSTAFLPDVSWNVEVIKDDQVSRFYYKITYKTIE